MTITSSSPSSSPTGKGERGRRAYLSAAQREAADAARAGRSPPCTSRSASRSRRSPLIRSGGQPQAPAGKAAGRAVGYYASASASVQHRDVTGKMRRNMPDPVPVILLSRLAVDRKKQSSGIGKNLLRDAILRSVAASEIIGVRALIVHALNDTTRAFYAHFGFEPSPTDPLHLLLMKMARAVTGR